MSSLPETVFSIMEQHIGGIYLTAKISMEFGVKTKILRCSLQMVRCCDVERFSPPPRPILKCDEAIIEAVFRYGYSNIDMVVHKSMKQRCEASVRYLAWQYEGLGAEGVFTAEF